MTGAICVEGQFAGRLGAFCLDASFTLAPRGITALTGPSGSGKTTLLRCIAGLTRLPGRLTVAGQIWQNMSAFVPTHRRAVGVVFQDASLLSHLSVMRNLTYGQRRAAEPPTIKLDEVVELLGLETLLARSPRNLSGGERQRVSLGRALLSQPRLLLMDEPLSSLDIESKAEIMPYLERLHRALAIPALYVTHDMSEVRRLADHLLEMQAGRIVKAERDVRVGEADDAALAGMTEEAIRKLALEALRAGLG